MAVAARPAACGHDSATGEVPTPIDRNSGE
jgi:hypothetical protein